MRIRAQLFLGIAALMCALMAIQWWLQTRQLQALEQELTSVATSVSKTLVLGRPPEADESGPADRERIHLKVLEKAEAKADGWEMQERQVRVDGDRVVRREVFVRRASPDPAHEGVPSTVPGSTPQPTAPEPQPDDNAQPSQPDPAALSGASPQMGRGEKVLVVRHGQDDLLELPPPDLGPLDELEFRVERLVDGHDRLLIIKGMPGGERRIPIPTEKAATIVRTTREQALAASALLLLFGLLAAGTFAHRVTRPLRQLAVGVDAVGRGELGTQIEASARGEVGDLQTAFNRMSHRLAELEAERERWRAREHLAELGELARGLGHTLRNPLNTLGLVVEELASRESGGEDLVATARGQIRRIDGWLRSFLAVGAGQAAAQEPVDLTSLVQDVALEAIQQGAPIELELDEAPIRVWGVAPALRAALANLVGNAIEASPEGTPVHIRLEPSGDAAVLRIQDRGPGLPSEVRENLFSPHITTKAGGSGMGLFLARQLIEGGHGGSVEIGDGQDGGTVATIRLPMWHEE